MNRMYNRLLPELSRFPTTHDAEQALKKACRRLLRDRRYWMIGVAVWTIYVLVAAAGQELVAGHVNRNTVLLWTPLLAGVLALPVAVIQIWLCRRYIQGSIRREMVERGMLVCVHCGYDLTGNISGICPECGTPVRLK